LSPGQRPGLDEKFQSKKVPTLAKKLKKEKSCKLQAASSKLQA